MMNVGLIGAGRIGRIHARTIAHHVPQARIARVVDIAPQTAREWAGELGIDGVSADVRDIFGDPGNLDQGVKEIKRISPKSKVVVLKFFDSYAV